MPGISSQPFFEAALSGTQYCNGYINCTAAVVDGGGQGEQQLLPVRVGVLTGQDVNSARKMEFGLRVVF